MIEKPKLVIGITIAGSVPLIRGQAKYFVDKGFDVYLMVPDEEKSRRYCAEEGCSLLPVEIERYISPLKDLKTIFHIYRTLSQLKPDIVNVGTPKMGLLGAIGAWLARVPGLVYTCRGLRYEHETGTQRKLLVTTEKIAGALAGKIICISPSVAEKALQDEIFKEEKVRVIGKGSSNGLNLDRFSPDSVAKEDAAMLKEELGLNGCFVFGFVGRLVDRKGINELVAAFKLLHQKMPNARLVLVGKSDKTQLTNPQIVEEVEQHPGIVWVGWQDNIPLYMSIFDVFVMPAWWEGFGNTYLEAAAMGKPVIGSEGTGCKDAVNPGFNGVMVPIKDVDTLLTAMQELISDEELLKKYGENGPAWAQHFRPEAIWDGIHTVYKELLKASTAENNSIA